MEDFYYAGGLQGLMAEMKGKEPLQVEDFNGKVRIETN